LHSFPRKKEATAEGFAQAAQKYDCPRKLPEQSQSTQSGFFIQAKKFFKRID